MNARSSQPAEPATAGLLRTFSASLAALVAGLVLMLWTTEGGSAFTTETARRAAVERAPQPLPDLSVVGADGEVTTLGRLFASGGRVWIVDFVYTRCQTVCSALGSIYQQLQQRILDGDLKGRVGLLSISFDPGRDDAAALRGYAARMRMDVDVWRIVTLTSAADRRRLLDAFGIMVVPAPLGEFEHNAALHIVDGQGQLVHIVDYDSPAQALALARVLAP